MKLLPFLLLLSACASEGPEYCVVTRDGQLVLLFQGSRDQKLTFERDFDRTSPLKPRDWSQPATVPEWKR
jgi:hypothetical protein